ncbi:uncharacterized protein LOC124894414 [Capsicum annuum]|uniref:uncharacterized protein LOC124891519 n=1 Tax=Capsicum annuum TaxID=4072 RepID=UPI001FB0A766|nr:uncharacterized protein LOC124891519 [Capsicum annuum]XP_047261060.1 uncharacterized protein LOC124894414 [Capsicum annuum]
MVKDINRPGNLKVQILDFEDGEMVVHEISTSFLCIEVTEKQVEDPILIQIMKDVVFHVSMLKKCIGDHSLVLPVEKIKVTDSLSYEEEPIPTLDRQVRRLRNKGIASVKVLWRNQKVEEAT